MHQLARERTTKQCYIQAAVVLYTSHTFLTIFHDVDHECYSLSKNKPYLLIIPRTMADNDKIVFPDEVDDVKEAAAEEKVAVEAGDNNSVESTPANPGVSMRNMITVPANCPEGYQMGSDGVCRQVF